MDFEKCTLMPENELIIKAESGVLYILIINPGKIIFLLSVICYVMFLGFCYIVE